MCSQRIQYANCWPKLRRGRGQRGSSSSEPRSSSASSLRLFWGLVGGGAAVVKRSGLDLDVAGEVLRQRLGAELHLLPDQLIGARLAGGFNIDGVFAARAELLFAVEAIPNGRVLPWLAGRAGAGYQVELVHLASHLVALVPPPQFRHPPRARDPQDQRANREAAGVLDPHGDVRPVIAPAAGIVDLEVDLQLHPAVERRFGRFRRLGRELGLKASPGSADEPAAVSGDEQAGGFG